jgi:hypothetical protein
MFPMLGSRLLIMQQLDYNNGTAVFSTWSVSRSYKRDEVSSLVESEFCKGVCEEITRAGGRGIAIVGAVTGKRLVTNCVL